jgi:hypothetical protein
MAKEPEEYIKVTRRSTTGGAHLYINADIMNRALESAELPIESNNLVMKSYSCKDRKGEAKILIKLKSI